MRKISIPKIEQIELCNSFTDLQYVDRIIEINNQYEERISDLSAFSNEENMFIETNPEYKDYMKKMYSQRFANKGYPNQYKFYQEIRSSQKYCPYCNYPTREVKQIDHFIPKSKFPSLSLVVKNLVPICKECNEIKEAFFSIDKRKQFIHPYFDNGIEESFNFIKCKLIEDENIGFKFYIKKLDEWDDTFFDKVKFHFEKLGIDKLYLSDFITDYDVSFTEYRNLYKICGRKDYIIMLLENKIKTYADRNIMPWRYSGYRCILENEWFWQKFERESDCT